MKKWVSAFAIVSLIAVSTFVIYKEALARPPLCDWCAAYCYTCNGYYQVDSCWVYNGLLYCLVDCQNCNPGCICGSTICVD
jgi:hypothetical protein